MISIYRDGETFGPFTMEQIVSKSGGTTLGDLNDAYTS
jgi:hypothetical protein